MIGGTGLDNSASRGIIAMLQSIPDLAIFDLEAIAQHGITEGDLHRVWRYVTILQGARSSVLRDMAAGCYYGTSALLHEVIELRILLVQEPWLLTYGRSDLQEALKRNEDAHLEGLVVEYVYLQEKIRELFDEEIGIGDLIRANASSLDFWSLFRSLYEVPLFLPTRAGIQRAKELIKRLKAWKE